MTVDDVPLNDPEALRAFLVNLGRRPTSEELEVLSAKQTTPEAKHAFQVVWTDVLGWEDPGPLDDDPIDEAHSRSLTIVMSFMGRADVTEDEVATARLRLAEINKPWPGQLEEALEHLDEVLSGAEG
jgi:hypothetical protein